ncbi:MAG TPA: DUF1259 domain-containing protein [Opitutaceae bacterium]|nr:DUF1259 domain-containing protein [Opitutaceae bacterium]
MKLGRWLAPIAAMMTAISALAATDWKPVQETLGRKGEVDDGVLRVTFERSDLQVTKGGVPVSADLVFDCWYGFWPMKSGDVMLMGDTCVREDELPAVEKEIHEQGLDLTALHNHLIGETPKIMFLHLSGRGTPAELARKVKAVLARTSTPTGPKKEETEKEKPDWSTVMAVLGKPAESEGDIIEYGFQRREHLTMDGEPLPSTDALETAPEVKFQMLKDGRAVTYGEMILTANEVAPVFHVLAENGIEIDALHNHMTAEEPRLFFMHWWAVGKPETLARGVKAALGQVNLASAK